MRRSIDLRNGEELTVAISKALRAHMIAPTEPSDEDEDESPNAPTPAAPAEITVTARASLVNRETSCWDPL
jgi:hypothetical protein